MLQTFICELIKYLVMKTQKGAMPLKALLSAGITFGILVIVLVVNQIKFLSSKINQIYSFLCFL